MPARNSHPENYSFGLEPNFVIMITRRSGRTAKRGFGELSRIINLFTYACESRCDYCGNASTTGEKTASCGCTGLGTAGSRTRATRLSEEAGGSRRNQHRCNRGIEEGLTIE